MIIILLVLWLIGWYLACWLEYNGMKKYFTGSDVFGAFFYWPIILFIFIFFNIVILIMDFYPTFFKCINIRNHFVKSFDILNKVFFKGEKNG
jgi:hypothetical protein